MTFKDITVTILLGEKEFIMNDNGTPLVLEKRIEVESIELRID